MGLQENLRNSLFIYKEVNNLSVSELADQLDISRSALQNCLSCKSSPRMNTLAHIADRLGIDPAVLISGEFKPDQADAILALFNSLQYISSLPREKWLRLAELFREAVELMSPDDNDDDTGRPLV